MDGGSGFRGRRASLPLSVLAHSGKAGGRMPQLIISETEGCSLSQLKADINSRLLKSPGAAAMSARLTGVLQQPVSFQTGGLWFT